MSVTVGTGGFSGGKGPRAGGDDGISTALDKWGVPPRGRALGGKGLLRLQSKFKRSLEVKLRAGAAVLGFFPLCLSGKRTCLKKS